jgi:hypothetical protein
MSARDMESLAAQMVDKFGLSTSVAIVELAKEAEIYGDDAALQKLVKKCRDAGINVRVPAGAHQQTFGFDTTFGFLGEEFLLWLWFKWETEGGEFALDGGRIVGVAIDDVLVFAPKSDDEHQQTIRHGLPTRTPEARTGLRTGHRVAKARLLIAEGERQWSLMLDGESMQLGSVKLPDDAEDCESASDRTADRASNWLALHQLVAALYGRFVEVRCSEAWSGEADAMANWMAR